MVKVDFDDVEVTDDAEDGKIAGVVINSIYKGNYYQCIIKTDDQYDFFVDTDDDWLKGDRVGINIAKDKIIVEKLEEEVSDEKEEKMKKIKPFFLSKKVFGYPYVLFMLIFVIMPLVLILVNAFLDTDGYLTLENFKTFFTENQVLSFWATPCLWESSPRSSACL